MKITNDCKVQAKFIEVNRDDLVYSLMDYYKTNDEYTYVSLKKDQMAGKNKTLKRVLKNGGDENVKKEIEKKMSKEELINLEVELINDNVLIIVNDEDFDDIEEYKYDEELDMYFNETSKVFVRPDLWSSDEIIWFSYLKILNRDNLAI